MATLREQYPLSPRKFWKKMLSGNTGGYHRGGGVLGLIIYLIVFGFYAIQLLSIKPDASNPIAGDLQAQFQSYIFIGGGFILGVIVIYYIAKALYVSAYIRSYFYDSDNSFITIKKGVFTPAEIHVQWSKVQDVYVDQDLLDRMLGIYDVHIATATIGSAIEAHIDGVDKEVADGLKAYILGRVQSNPTAPTNTFAAGARVPNPLSAPSVNLQEVVGKSSDVYPLTSRWLLLSAIGWLFGSLFLAGIVVLCFLIYASFKLTGTMLQIDNMGAVANQSGFNLTGIFIAAFIVIFVYEVVKLFLWRQLFRFEFMPEYLVFKSGIISREEKHILYRSVQDVIVQQTFWGRIMGIATVKIQNAAGNGMWGTAVIPGLANSSANAVAELLRKVSLSVSATQTGL